MDHPCTGWLGIYLSNTGVQHLWVYYILPPLWVVQANSILLNSILLQYSHGITSTIPQLLMMSLHVLFPDMNNWFIFICTTCNQMPIRRWTDLMAASESPWWTGVKCELTFNTWIFVFLDPCLSFCRHLEVPREYIYISPWSLPHITDVSSARNTPCWMKALFCAMVKESDGKLCG